MKLLAHFLNVDTMEPPEQTPALQDRAAAAPSDADKTRLAGIGGEPLAGSGFEGEEPEPGFGSQSGYIHTKEIRMNPDENKQAVRNSIQAVWIDQNLDALPNFWTADCINHAMPEGADNRGLAVLRAYHEQFGAFLSAFSDVRIEILQQVAETDRVVTQLLTRARHTEPFMGIPASGKTVSLATIRIDRLEDGKIAEHWSVADMAGFMQQLQ